jgi:phage shock protein A
MGIFCRVTDIISANLNALLDRAENPEAMLAQVIREMEESLARARRYTALAIAAERRLRREGDDHRARAEQWRSRAGEALAAGREELARRALARKQEHDALARSLEDQHAEAVLTSQSARNALHALEARLAEAHRKQQTLLARHRTAQVRVEVHRHLGAGRADFGSSQARFDRLEDRLTRWADELTAEADLYDPAGLEAEFIDLEREGTIDRELEALKRERAGQS